MAISIKDLLTPLDKAAVARDFYAIFGVLIGYPVAFQAGEPTPAIIDSTIGLLVDKLWNPLVLPALMAVYLDYSFGDWLSLIAWLVYNRPRITAQAATGVIVVENTAGVFVGTIAVGQIRVRNGITGKTYTNTTGGAIAAYVSGSYPVPPAALQPYQIALTFEADEAGTGSNAQPGDLAVQPVSAPSGLRIQTNASPFLGSNFEGDPQLVTRARVAVTSRSSSGPLGAYLDAALDPVVAFTSRNLPAPASWGTSAPAIQRVRVQQPGGGVVLVWCASASGPSGGDNTDPDSDVGRANVAIQMFVVPPGATCTVAAAVAFPLDLGIITLDVSAESRVTDVEARATVEAALDAFFSALPIGGARNVAMPTQGFVFAAKVFGVLTAGAGVETVVCSSFSVDVPVGGNVVVVPTWQRPIAVNIVTQGA